MDHDTFEEKTVTIGTPNKSEKKSSVGQSYTRECQSFVFQIKNRRLRFIEAPAIGEKQDLPHQIENFEDTPAYISQYEYLNGIL
jgi:hypothetical protein